MEIQKQLNSQKQLYEVKIADLPLKLRSTHDKKQWMN